MSEKRERRDKREEGRAYIARGLEFTFGDKRGNEHGSNDEDEKAWGT